MEQDSLARIFHTAQCKKNYESNECAPELRVPALEELCNEWSECMNSQNILKLAHLRHSAKFWAQTIAEVMNAFTDTISTKTIIYIVGITSVLIIVTNMTFGIYRSRFLPN